MRQVLIAIVLLAALAPGARAAEEPLLTDPEGDAQWVGAIAGARLPGAPAAGAPFVQGNDLVSFSLAETEDALSFTIEVANMEGEPQGTATVTELAFGGREYRLMMGYFTGSLSNSAGNAYAYLQEREDDAWAYVARLEPPVVDRAAGTLAGTLPKVYLMDAKQAIPGRGDTVEILRVAADANGIGFGVVQARVVDEMDAGVGIVMQLGDLAEGDLEMSAQDRVRVSNGGATTFVFQATLRNRGETAHTIRIGAEDLPAGWVARVQPQTVVIQPDEARTVSVLVSVPFAHEHGGHSSLNLTATSEQDPATRGRMRFSVLHTPIPQPAGHHRELFLHATNGNGGGIGAPFGTVSPFAYGWMNTLADHADDHEYVTPSNTNVNGAGATATWYIPLAPVLLMGLDFDLDDVATLDASLLGGSGDAEVAAELYYYRDTDNGGESILLAEGTPASVTPDPGSDVAFNLQLTPTPESDYIPYAPDTYLTLALRVTGILVESDSPIQPRLVTDSFRLELPLLEYHDRLTGAAEVASSLTITAKGPVERTGHGGSTITYAFDLAGAPGQVVTIDLAGSDATTARVVPAGTLTLGERPTEILVGVEVPTSANPGEQLEVLLFVHARDDPTQLAIARTMTRVAATGEDAAPDERAVLAAAQERARETPNGGAMLLLAIAGAAATTRRRSA